jgi:hypothetical protein
MNDTVLLALAHEHRNELLRESAQRRRARHPSPRGLGRTWPARPRRAR